VYDLGGTLDTELSMQRHVNKVAIRCFQQIRRLKQVHRLIGRELILILVSAFILSRLDYCNALLAGLPQSMIAQLQRTQNAAACLVTEIGFREHVTPPYSSYTGCQYSIALFLNYVSLCTKLTQ